MNKFFALTLAVLLPVSFAHAGTATLDFAETGDGTYDVSIAITPEAGDTTGLAGYNVTIDGLDALGVDSSAVTWTEVTLATLDSGTFTNVGFQSVLSQGPVGSDQFSAAHSQGAVSDPVLGIGINPVFVDGFDAGSFPDIDLGAPAVLGTLTFPSGTVLTTDNIDLSSVTLLPTAGGNPINPSSLDLTVTAIPGGPTAVPGDGGIIDLDAIFAAGGTTLEDAVVISDNTGVPTTSFDTGGFFTASVDGSSIDVSIDPSLDLSSLAPNTPISDTLTVSVDGTDFTYTVQATVPEPSTFGLVSLALAGILGLRRRG